MADNHLNEAGPHCIKCRGAGYLLPLGVEYTEPCHVCEGTGKQAARRTAAKRASPVCQTCGCSPCGCCVSPTAADGAALDLPELPKPVRMSSDQAYLGFTSEQMQQYAREAIAHYQRKQAGEPYDVKISGDGPFGGLVVKVDPSLPLDTIEMQGASAWRANLRTGEVYEVGNAGQEGEQPTTCNIKNCSAPATSYLGCCAAHETEFREWQRAGATDSEGGHHD